MSWRILFFLIITTASIILFTQSSYAAPDPPISVKAEMDHAFITIGDPVEYTVTIRHHANIEILSSVPAPATDVLKIKSIEEINRKEGSLLITGRKFKLTAFRLGEFILDPVKIEYRIKADSGTSPAPPAEIKSIETNRIFLTVKSVAEGEEKTDIRGVKSVLSLKGKNGIWLFAGFSILCVLTALAIYRYLNKKRPLTPLADTPQLSSAEEALQHLNELFESDLLRRGKIKEYFLRFSEVLRIYLEKRFQILAVESTTYEIISALRKNNTEQSFTQKLADVLESADLAKFARWKPEPAEIISLNKKSKELIEESRDDKSVSTGT